MARFAPSATRATCSPPAISTRSIRCRRSSRSASPRSKSRAATKTRITSRSPPPPTGRPSMTRGPDAHSRSTAPPSCASNRSTRAALARTSSPAPIIRRWWKAASRATAACSWDACCGSPKPASPSNPLPPTASRRSSPAMAWSSMRRTGAVRRKTKRADASSKSCKASCASATARFTARASARATSSGAPTIPIWIRPCASIPKPPRRCASSPCT